MTASYREAKRQSKHLHGVGLGLRWDFLDQALQAEELPLSFLEISPENYMKRGGYFPAALEKLKDRTPFLTHGLTMSVGAVDVPEPEYLNLVKREMQRVSAPFHSDHLCLSTAGPLVLHELLPLGITRRNALRVADRIFFIEDALGAPFAIENITSYLQPEAPDLREADFLSEILRRSEAGLLLDVNNLYVNAQNHGYDAHEFLRALPLEQVVQIHVAGHTELPPAHPAAPLLLDTHSAPVSDPVKELLRFTLDLVGPVPVLLEWDNDVPEFELLLTEIASLQELYEEVLGGLCE